MVGPRERGFGVHITYFYREVVDVVGVVGVVMFRLLMSGDFGRLLCSVPNHVGNNQSQYLSLPHLQRYQI